MRVLTIGFTKKPAERFFGLLSAAGAKRIVDVRFGNASQLAPTRELLGDYRKGRIGWTEYETGPDARTADRGDGRTPSTRVASFAARISRTTATDALSPSTYTIIGAAPRSSTCAASRATVHTADSENDASAVSQRRPQPTIPRGSRRIPRRPVSPCTLRTRSKSPAARDLIEHFIAVAVVPVGNLEKLGNYLLRLLPPDLLEDGLALQGFKGLAEHVAAPVVGHGTDSLWI